MKLVRNDKLTAYQLNCGYIQKAIFETEKGNIFTLRFMGKQKTFTLTENKLFYIVVGSFCLVGGALVAPAIRLILTFVLFIINL